MTKIPVLMKVSNSSRGSEIGICGFLLLAIVIAYTCCMYFGQEYFESFGTEPAPLSTVPQEPVELGLDVCHPDCCCDTQWPIPADVSGSSPGADLLEFEKTPLKCRGCNGVGCVCAKKGEGKLPVCNKSA